MTAARPMPAARAKRGSVLVARLPLALTLLRLALAPLLLALALWRPAPSAFAACLIGALLSDYFDGVIARRLGVATPALRRLDSAADSAFYLAALAAAWHLHPAVLRAHAAGLAALAVLELARYAVDAWKFGREASYHLWSSKLWGLALFAGFFALLVGGRDGAAVSLAIGCGIAADLEGLLVSALLPRWACDVPTL